MSEIDVTYCKFARLNDVCASPINTQECKCSKIPIQMCYYKQLQQYKNALDEIEEICKENKYPNDEYDFVAFFANKILQKIKEVKDNG